MSNAAYCAWRCAFGGRRFVRTIRMRDDIDHRLSVDDANVGVHLPHCDGWTRSPRGRVASSTRLRGRVANGLKIPMSPPAQAKNEISLTGTTHGGPSVSRVATSANAAENAAKPFDEIAIEDVQPVRPAVVEQIPQDLNTSFTRGHQHRDDTAEVVCSGRALDRGATEYRLAPSACRHWPAGRNRAAPSDRARSRRRRPAAGRIEADEWSIRSLP